MKAKTCFVLSLLSCAALVNAESNFQTSSSPETRPLPTVKEGKSRKHLFMPKKDASWRYALTLNMSAYHLGSRTSVANEINPGIGFEGRKGMLGFQAGFYRNSFDRETFYALGMWTPLSFKISNFYRAEIGAAAGLASGYQEYANVIVEHLNLGKVLEQKKRSLGIVPVGGFVFSLTPTQVGGLGFDLVFTPPIHRINFNGFMALQAKIKLK